MFNHIRKDSSLLMVTDTAMVRKNGEIFAFGPVVRELNVFKDIFPKITWIGFNRPDLIEDPTLIPVPEDIRCILLKRSGGDTFIKKIKVLIETPRMFWIILIHLVNYRVIHTRAPSSPAFIATICSFFFPKKIWWHKYAGNWGQVDSPYFFRMQRKLLKKVCWCKVTINGTWPNQPAHCLSFENPCLDDFERVIGESSIQGKDYSSQLNLCFVGRLEIAKGIDLLFESIRVLESESKISLIHIVGDGPLRPILEKLAVNLPFRVFFHGVQSREKVVEIFKSCHFNILPSKAEGFPKVIAEGSNYGCIPIVTNISGIGQYILHEVNGFLLSPDKLTPNLMANDIRSALYHPNLKDIAKNAYLMSSRFTFNNFSNRIIHEILN